MNPADSQVFRKTIRREGDDGVHTYRLPGLATTAKGTLIAIFDERLESAHDLPRPIDVGTMRSTDNGATWSKMQTILAFDHTEAGAMGNGVGDAAVLVDRKTGNILVVGLWSHGDRGGNGSGPGLSPEETGQMMMTRSVDDGVTWSPPINITRKIAGRDPKWHLCFQGPGKGIQLTDGTLVFAAQIRDSESVYHSCFIYSRDGGDNWTISPMAIPTTPPTSESQIAQLPDGSLLLSMRDESRGGQRLWARYDWKGSLADGHWSKPWRACPDPTCMASLISLPSGELIFSNCNSAKDRVAMTIRTSRDGGHTWSVGHLLDPRHCAYSCLTELADGRIGILYECGDSNPYQTLEFARFPLQWVTGK